MDFSSDRKREWMTLLETRRPYRNEQTPETTICQFITLNITPETQCIIQPRFQ